MPLSIIGAGLGRTGTTSLKQALEQLGLGPCYHGEDLLANSTAWNLWHRALDLEGWEPLCNFLSVPIPDIPFPAVNSKTKFPQDPALIRNLLTEIHAGC